MSIVDRRMDPNGAATIKALVVPLTTAVSQTALSVFKTTPGFAFEVVGVEAFASGVTAVISVNVLIGTTTVLASVITPVADTSTEGTLATARSARRGSSTATLNVVYTSDGAGALVNGRVVIYLRPYPLGTETQQ